jgi:hypothetical protein
MPSQLLTNEAISFIVGKPFLFNGTVYDYGQEFDQDEVRIPSNNIETLVRNRFLIPVVDSYDDKPRHWYREIKLRSDVEAKMAKRSDSVEEQLPAAPDVPVEEFDPSNFSVKKVKAYVNEHPEETQVVLNKEENGKNRSTLVRWLYDQLEG